MFVFFLIYCVKEVPEEHTRCFPAFCCPDVGWECRRSRIFASCVVKHFFGCCFSARKCSSLHQYSSAQMNRGIRCRKTVGNLDEHDVETAMYL